SVAVPYSRFSQAGMVLVVVGSISILRVLEEVVDADLESTSDLECEFERGRVLALLDRDECLTGDADATGEIGLGDPGLLTSQADAVGDESGLDHQTSPRR